MTASFAQGPWLWDNGGMDSSTAAETFRLILEGWDAVRKSFLKNLARAHAIAKAKPFKHKMKSKDMAIRNLLNLAVHDAYHIGQITLMKRVLRKTKK